MLLSCGTAFSEVTVGLEALFSEQYTALLQGKKIGLITNHTAITKRGKTALECFKEEQSDYKYTLKAIFAPEHGLYGAEYAGNKVKDSSDDSGIPVYSLHGNTRRPTAAMLSGVDTFVFDIQDIGARCYTYASTLCYAMEEAAKHKIDVIVLDRPNPINGISVDGPCLEDKWRSFVGYVNVPYCHGMTIGELARYFNEEGKVGCHLTVVPMKGWKRKMTFADTGLPWIPTSPQIPEASTPLFYPATGILGELCMVNIGVGYTLPFKVVAAPWIDADAFARKLNDQKFPGVYFTPIHYKPYFGLYAKELCHGVLIHVTDLKGYRPAAAQFLLMGMLKGLYPDKFNEAIQKMSRRKAEICKVAGTEELWHILAEEKNIVWKLRAIHEAEREAFLSRRRKHLLY